MKSVAANAAFVRHEQNLDVYVLQNESLEISLVPELGAKIISLVNRQTGREWMSRPAGGRRLFRNRLGDDFARSTLVGWDECLPTIAPCIHKGRSLPDHGEVWSVPWAIDLQAFKRGELKTSVVLAVSPFRFERAITLEGNEIHLRYQLESLSNEPEQYLWAMHPLVPVCPGDALELTQEMRELLGDHPWLKNLEFGSGQPDCAKTYAGPIHDGRAAIKNLHRGDRMAFSWDTRLNPTLGIWLTRGGWNGQHHQALEPCNGWPDALAEACTLNQCGVVPPHAKLNWEVTIQIQPVTISAILAPTHDDDHDLQMTSHVGARISR